MHQKIEGNFIGKLDAMKRCVLGIKYCTNQPIGKMLKVAEGNGDMKRKILAKTESIHKMNNRIKKEKKEIKDSK